MSQISLCRSILIISRTVATRKTISGVVRVPTRWNQVKASDKEPIKFTTSEANLNYKATLNFYGDTSDLPDSHNAFIAASFIFAFFYLIFLRDDIEESGGQDWLIKPVHETVPQIAIPLLLSAIAENKKFGRDTHKLEKKLAEYMKEPEKHGGDYLAKPKLVEN